MLAVTFQKHRAMASRGQWLLSIEFKLEIRHQTKVMLHNDHISCNFLITLSYVIHTVKNNSGSCDTL